MLGKMGCSYQDYCTMPVKTAINAVIGYGLGRQEQVQNSWEQARFIASAMSKEAGNIKFEWEKQKASSDVILSHEEYLKRYERYYGKNKHSG